MPNAADLPRPPPAAHASPIVRIPESPGEESTVASTQVLPRCPCFPLAGAAAAGEGMGWSVPPSQHPAARLLSALQDNSLFSVSPFRKNSVVTLVPGVVSKIGNWKNICWLSTQRKGGTWWHRGMVLGPKLFINLSAKENLNKHFN